MGRKRGVSMAWGAAQSRRGRSVTAARKWHFVLVDALGFVLIEVLVLVGGVTVNSVEEHC